MLLEEHTVNSYELQLSADEPVRSDDYPTVCRVLRAAKCGITSVSVGAERLGTFRKTVHRCLERPDRYDPERRREVAPSHFLPGDVSL